MPYRWRRGSYVKKLRLVWLCFDLDALFPPIVMRNDIRWNTVYRQDSVPRLKLVLVCLKLLPGVMLYQEGSHNHRKVYPTSILLSASDLNIRILPWTPSSRHWKWAWYIQYVLISMGFYPGKKREGSEAESVNQNTELLRETSAVPHFSDCTEITYETTRLVRAAVLCSERTPPTGRITDLRDVWCLCGLWALFYTTLLWLLGNPGPQI